MPDTPEVAAEREVFEKWISGPPFEQEIGRNLGLDIWPNDYKELAVSLAWHSWLERFKKAEARVLEVEERCGDVMMKLANAEKKLADAMHEMAMETVKKNNFESALGNLKAVFRVNMLRLKPDTTHEEIDRVIAAAINNENPRPVAPHRKGEGEPQSGVDAAAGGLAQTPLEG